MPIDWRTEWLSVDDTRARDVQVHEKVRMAGEHVSRQFCTIGRVPACELISIPMPINSASDSPKHAR